MSREGPDPEVDLAYADCRFTPESGLNPDIATCPLCARTMAAHTRFVFSLQMRLPLPGLFRVSGCEAAGLCNQVRHTEPL
jgi:hypothetical protein